MRILCFLPLLCMPFSDGAVAELKKKFQEELAAAKQEEKKIADILRHPVIATEKEVEEIEDQVALYVADKVSQQVHALILAETKKAFAALT